MSDDNKTRLAYEDMLLAFAEYGEALFLAQHFEDGMRLLRSLRNHERSDEKGCQITTSRGEGAPETLRPLLEDTMQSEYFTGAEKDILRTAVKERNYLVHTCWNDFARVMTSPTGRTWIVESISKRTDLFRRAISIVNTPLNERLKQTGATLESITSLALERWETGFEAPPENLH